MTGYGVASADAPGARVTVEVRGVNQRFLDVKVSVPREYAGVEAEIRERVRAIAHRGRVEVGVGRAPLAGARRYRVAVRRELARAYVEAARDLGRTLGLDGAVTLAEVLRLPDLFEVSEPPPDLRAEAGGSPSPTRHAGAHRGGAPGRRPDAGARAAGDRTAPPAGGGAARPAPGRPARRRPAHARGGAARRARGLHRGAGAARGAPRRARSRAARGRSGRQAHLLPPPGDPPRAHHGRREGPGPRNRHARPRGARRGREAPRAGAECRVSGPC